jgi:hypothetical protein
MAWTTVSIPGFPNGFNKKCTYGGGDGGNDGEELEQDVGDVLGKDEEDEDEEEEVSQDDASEIIEGLIRN